MKKVELEVFDVTTDGFPTKADNAVCFIWDSNVFYGWPLIDTDNSYPDNRHFASPEQAKAGPLNVLWEASEDRVHGEFSGVRFWFRKPSTKPE